MEITKLIELVPIHMQCGRVKPLKRNFKLLKLKSNCLFDERDAIKKEIIKDVMQGKIPPRECQKWLKKVVEFEHQVHDILAYEHTYSDLDVATMEIRDRLTDMIKEIAEFLEKSPFKHSPVFDVSHGFSKRITGLMTEGKAYGTAKTAKMGKLHTKSDGKSEQSVGSLQSPALKMESAQKKLVQHIKDADTSTMDTSLQKPEDKRQDAYVTTEVKSIYGKEAERVSVANLQGEKAPALTSELDEMLVPELPNSSAKKAEAKHQLAHLPGAQIAIYESQIALIPSETKEKLSTKEKQDVETISEKKEKSSSNLNIGGTLHTAESNSIIPSGTKRQMKPKRKIKRLVELTKPLAVTKPGPNSKTMKEEESPINAQKSINSTVQKILACMKDAKARSIGIYGMGGIGKTTTLKALINYPETKRMFDLKIWVSLSRSWSIRKVQQEVAIQLGLSVPDSQTNSEIAEKLFRALRSRKFLLLLDNVWEMIDLGAVGIPDPSPENGCKIVMSSRSIHVCVLMAPDEQIKVEGLSTEEAWELFHEQVGGIIDSPDIHRYAQAIVAACGDLPLSIIVTGRALREESDVPQWKLAVRDFFSASPLKLNDNEALLQQLKFSYDRLKAREVKSCFLYCALFPEDHKFKDTELVDYCVQECLIAGHSADEHGRGVVKDLVDASLLECVDGGLSVKMHDVIRDLALWIISSEEDGPQLLVGTDVGLTQPLKKEIEQGGQISLGDGSFPGTLEGEESASLSSMDQVLFTRAAAGLTKLQPEEEWEQTKMIFLMDNEFSRLPERPSCPKLLMLFLQRNSRLRTIPSSFFDCMPLLQVLNLSNTKVRSLPPSLFKLTRLQVLNLRNCECLSELPPEVGNLECIEVLDLWGTEIYNLPDEIGKLSSLKHLRVSFYGSIDHSEYGRLPKNLITGGVILRLLALKELSIAVHPGDPRWDKNAKFVAQDLGSLKELTNLHFCFPEVKFLELFIKTSRSWISGGLSKFKFVVGQNIKRVASRVPKNVELGYDHEDRCLRYVNDDMVHEKVKEVLMRATAFYLDHHCTISSLSEFGITYIKQLKFCIVRECPNISTIVESSNEVTESALPNLEHLSLHYLWNLRSICEEGGMPFGCFNVLRTLSVHTCPNLEFVLTQSMLQHLSSLEELTIDDCASVKEIVKMEEEIVDYSVIGLPKLRSLELHYLPELVRIWNGSCLKRVQINYSNCPKFEDFFRVSDRSINRD